MYSSLDVLKKQFTTELKDSFSERECQQLFYRFVEYVTGLKRVDVALEPTKDLSTEQSDVFVDILNRLTSGEPPQYIDQTAYFLEHQLFVDPSVLIPRPETEELVTWILQQHDHEALKVLDIGTGSGAIAVSLAHKRPHWQVLACDVSNEALMVARRNAREILSQSEIAFYKEDILSPSTQYKTSLDLIVSNPPYVLESDQKTMEDNVLQYEPHLALFVPDSDALRFYKAILEYAATNLKIGGYVYFEIHEAYGEEVNVLLNEQGYNKVQVRNDLQGRPRMICGQRL